MTTFEYDDLGRRVKVTMPDPDGAGPLVAPETTTTYDAAGRVLTVADKLANTTSYAYDNLGRVVAETDAEGGVTGYTYDLVGNRTSLTDPESNTTNWVYDDLDRVIEETNQLGFTRYFVYNAGGYLTRRTDRLGRVRQFEYDGLGRNTAEVWYDSAADADVDLNRQNTLAFTYDAAGQVTSAGDPFAQYDYAYDGLGRAVAIDQQIAGLTPMVSFAQQYDAAGRRTQLAAAVGSTPDFVTDYVYDALGRIDSIQQQSQPGGSAVAEKYVDFAFDAAGQPDSLTRYADLAGSQLVARTDYVFDAAGRLTGMTHAKGAATLADYAWEFDPAGRMTRFVSSTDGTVDYTNDATGQLTGADYDYQSDESYVYDDNGNRVSGGYTVGANNQMTSDGTFAYLYDAEGNRTHKFLDHDADGQLGSGDTDITQYAWDHRNRL